jgi:hypothetical protein
LAQKIGSPNESIMRHSFAGNLVRALLPHNR